MNSDDLICSILTPSLSLVGHSPQRECVSVHVVSMFLFPSWDQRGLLLLSVPNLLVGDVYHVKNEGCLLEVFIMRLFNQTLCINDAITL